jgi:hypothetical protein
MIAKGSKPRAWPDGRPNAAGPRHAALGRERVRPSLLDELGQAAVLCACYVPTRLARSHARLAAISAERPPAFLRSRGKGGES